MASHHVTSRIDQGGQRTPRYDARTLGHTYRYSLESTCPVELRELDSHKYSLNQPYLFTALITSQYSGLSFPFTDVPQQNESTYVLLSRSQAQTYPRLRRE